MTAQTSNRDIVDRLRASEPLPACPYDKLSPHYLTAPDDKPCAICGGLNDSDAPDLCRGADTRIMGEAANEIERLRLAATRGPVAEAEPVALDRDELRALCIDLASVNLTREVAERQANRIADGIIASVSRPERSTESSASGDAS